MRWTPGGPSKDVEDRRGEGGGGGIGGLHIGLGGAAVLLVLSLVFHRNFFALLSGGSSAPQSPEVTAQQNAAEQPEVQFVTFVVDDAQATWTKILGDAGVPYRHAKLVLFRDSIDSACGMAQTASGPFYCPEDEKVYIDLGFYQELKERFGASGDFAQAYVIAHELGHHIQRLVGTQQKVQAAMERDSRNAKSQSVMLELQADCYAGIWGHSTAQRNILESGDVEEGLNAAAAVGDDRIQRMSGRSVNPDGFTHGSAAQRSQWFKRGFQSGRMEDCDTFREGQR
jgi:predicted metalloprotease